MRSMLWMVVLTTLGCGARQAEEPAAASVSAVVATEAAAPAGKPEAPVMISAELGADRALVTVRFETEGSGVEVEASGARGLALTGPSRLSSARVATQEVLTLEVPFKPGPGESLLSVAVTGTFSGKVQRSVRAFAVGEPGAKPEVIELGGVPIRAKPAKTR